MRSTDKSPVLKRFEVRHPEYGTTVVDSIGPDSATVQAAKQWGADWGKIAGYCTWRNLGPSRKPLCRSCGREYGKAGDPKGLCPDCERAEEFARRQMARLKTPDRRPGYRT